MNDALLFFRIFLNHSTTDCEFLHCLTCTEERTSLLILSRIILLSFPMPDLDGLISQSFYPSISPELFHKAINFVKTIHAIPDKDTSIIMQSRRTLLFNDREPRLKKSGNEEFDVPMGCFDGAEVCELVGVHILHLLRTVMRKENIGLYRDDGLSILQNSSGPETEQKRIQIIQIF